MKTRDAARKGAYIGAGAGLVLFALFGLLPGSLIGGAAGINIAGWLFGLPLEPGLISRVIVLASMLVGVLVAGIVIVTATSTVGWLAGKLMETGAAAKEAEGRSCSSIRPGVLPAAQAAISLMGARFRKCCRGPKCGSCASSVTPTPRCFTTRLSRASRTAPSATAWSTAPT